jgi:hypothetical protein
MTAYRPYRGGLSGACNKIGTAQDIGSGSATEGRAIGRVFEPVGCAKNDNRREVATPVGTQSY